MNNFINQQNCDLKQKLERSKNYKKYEGKEEKLLESLKFNYDMKQLVE